MKKNIRKILMGILLAVFAFSTVMMLRQWMDNTDGEAAYSDAAQIALHTPKEEAPKETQPMPASPPAAEKVPVSYWVPAPVGEDAMMEEMAQINLEALREVNADVVGWIRIPDTKIDYPVMQGEDNTFYLEHTWEKVPNSVGSIFMECINSPDLMDFNTIVYGHNMGNGSMFAQLQNYAVQEYWETHPYVYLVTDAGVYRYEVFAFYRADVDSLTYGLNPSRDDTKVKFLELALESSWIDTDIEPAITDRFLTLSTCTGADYSNRYVVQARLVMMEITS